MADRQELNRNLAQMLKGGVIMDVTTPEQAKIAEAAGAYFLDAAKVAYPSDADGVHMTEDGHIALAGAVSEAVQEIFGV